MPRYRLLIPKTAATHFPNLPEPRLSGVTDNLIFDWQASELDPRIREKRIEINRQGRTAIYFEIRNWKSVFFDMDSTAIGQETIVELAACAGRSEEVSRITEEAMAGQLDFIDALNKRVATLEGLPLSIYESVKPRLIINPGLREFSQKAIEKGIKLYLVSGGFIPFARDIASSLGFSGSHANNLDDDGEKLLGTVSGIIVDGEEKKNFLLQTASSLNQEPNDIIAVGDGANDLAMMSVAGLAIGYKPKPVLIDKVDGAIFDSHLSLLDIISVETNSYKND